MSDDKVSRSTNRPRPLTASHLARWPLPATASEADKELRGHVLVVGGSAEIPGAALLAATAALRAGAGKLTMAVPRCVAQGLALAMPEARVIGLGEVRSGAISPSEAGRLASLGDEVSAVVIGPGMVGEAQTVQFVRELLPHFQNSVIVLDAYAMSAAQGMRFAQPIAMTPHCGEMAHLTGDSKEQVVANPLEFARSAANLWGACIALKGADTYLAEPRGAAYRYKGGTPGLAISGSGDTLAGIIAGLAARGTPTLQACAWGVVLHALAGRTLARRQGPLGFLARELADQIPRLLAAHSCPRPHSANGGTRAARSYGSGRGV